MPSIARVRLLAALVVALLAVAATPALAQRPGAGPSGPPAAGQDDGSAAADDASDDAAGDDTTDDDTTGDDDPSAADDPGCDEQDLVAPFGRWHDSREYALGADFEDDLADWTLDRGARAGDGNERFDVGDEQDGGSLVLPAGAVATSPPICVPDQAAFGRMFTRASKGGRLRVEALAVEGDATRRVGTLRARSRTWRLSRRLALTAPGDAGAAGQVVLRLTALKGTWRVDDLYVDPPGTG
jgi:hypothetical protein